MLRAAAISRTTIHFDISAVLIYSRTALALLRSEGIPFAFAGLTGAFGTGASLSRTRLFKLAYFNAPRPGAGYLASEEFGRAPVISESLSFTILTVRSRDARPGEVVPGPESRILVMVLWRNAKKN